MYTRELHGELNIDFVTSTNGHELYAPHDHDRFLVIKQASWKGMYVRYSLHFGPPERNVTRTNIPLLALLINHTTKKMGFPLGKHPLVKTSTNYHKQLHSRNGLH